MEKLAISVYHLESYNLIVTFIEQVVRLKRLVTAVFWSCEVFVKGYGHVDGIPT